MLNLPGFTLRRAREAGVRYNDQVTFDETPDSVSFQFNCAIEVPSQRHCTSVSRL